MAELSISPPTLDDSAPPLRILDAPVIAGGSPSGSRIPISTSSLGMPPQPTDYISQFRSRNMAAGIPLDVDSGVSPWVRMQLGFHRSEEDKTRFLRSRFGERNVRNTDDGQFIVRIMDENGNPQDRLVDPLSVQSGDVGEFTATTAVPVAGSIASIAATRGMGAFGKAKGFLGGFRDIVSGSIGAETAGGLQDLTVRLLEGAPINVGEIARERGKMAAIDMAIGGVLGITVGGTKILGSAFNAISDTGTGSSGRVIRNPFTHNRTEIQIDGARAQAELAEKYGIYVPMTPGELTGSPVLTRKESFVEKVPGGSAVFKGFRKEQMDAMERLQNVMIGSATPDADAVGQQATRALQLKIQPTEKAVMAAQREVADSALDQINRVMDSESVADRAVKQVYVGDAIRNRIVMLRDEAKAGADGLFARVKELGGDQPIFSGEDISKSAIHLRKQLPPRFKGQREIAGEASSLLDEFGKPIPMTDVLDDLGNELRTSSGKKVSVAFVPSDIRNMLDELIAAKGNNLRLSDLQQMRRRVYDDIAKGEAVPGVDTHYLSKIGGMLTETIEKGVEKLPTTELKEALQAANAFYKEKVLPFNKKGIAEMFRNDYESGYVGSASLADRYMGGAEAVDRWNTLKQFVGPDSIEIRLLKRQVFDRVLGGSMEPGGQLLNAKTFLRKMEDLRTTNPDMFDEVFGRNAGKMMTEASLLKASQEGASLPVDEIEKLLRSGEGITATKFKAAINAQEQEKTVFANKILDGLRDGKLDASKLQPTEFVNKFVDKASEPEIKQVLGMLGDRPALVEDIRSAALQKLFREHRELNHNIGEALKDAGTNRKMRTLLGEELFTDLERYGALQQMRLAAKQQAEAAGGFAAGSRVDMILTRPLFYVSDFLRENVTGRLLVNPAMRRWVLIETSASPTALYMAAASPQFLRSVVDEFGDDVEGVRKAEAFMGSLKRGLDEFVAQSGGRQATATIPAQTNRAIMPIRVSPPTIE